MTWHRDRVTAWIDALESGQYEQGFGRARQGDRFCAGGVGADVSGQGQWRDDLYCIAGLDKRDRAGVTAHVAAYYGLSPEDQREIVFINDTQRCPFPLIAAYLRQRLAAQEAGER